MKRRRQRLQAVDDPIEDRLLGRLDWNTMKHGGNAPQHGWPLLAEIALAGVEETFDPGPGAPGKFDTGQRDLLLYLEMHRAKTEGRSYRQTARDLAEEWQKAGLWQEDGEGLYKIFKTMRRRGVNNSMKRAALELWERMPPPRDIDELRNLKIPGIIPLEKDEAKS